MREVSLTMRASQDAASDDEVELILFVFDHPTLDAPIRLSTDPTERISAEPLMYGTRSSWQGADPETEPYLFVLASALVPTDTEDGPGPGELILDAVDVGIAETLRSITNRATVHLAVTLASEPDNPSAEHTNLRLMSAGGDAERITLQVSRQPIEDETVPMDRFTKSAFPGLFR
jgi:hypothetical protein